MSKDGDNIVNMVICLYGKRIVRIAQPYHLLISSQLSMIKEKKN